MSAKLSLPSGLVTFLFTDIEGSTRLAQLLGAEYRPMLAEHRRLLGLALGEGDGVALFTEGDSVFSAFPDASAAVRACAAGTTRPGQPRVGPPPGPAAGPYGPALRLAEPPLVSTPRLKSTGPPGSRRPPTAVRCCAPPPLPDWPRTCRMMFS